MNYIFKERNKLKMNDLATKSMTREDMEGILSPQSALMESRKQSQSMVGSFKRESSDPGQPKHPSTSSELKPSYDRTTDPMEKS